MYAIRSYYVFGRFVEDALHFGNTAREILSQLLRGNLFRRTSYKIEIGRQGLSAVGFDRLIVTTTLKESDDFLSQLQSRFATGPNDIFAGKLADFFQQLIQRVVFARLEFGIAEPTVQVALRKTDEDVRNTCRITSYNVCYTKLLRTSSSVFRNAT